MRRLGGGSQDLGGSIEVPLGCRSMQRQQWSSLPSCPEGPVLTIVLLGPVVSDADPRLGRIMLVAGLLAGLVAKGKVPAGCHYSNGLQEHCIDTVSTRQTPKGCTARGQGLGDDTCRRGGGTHATGTRRAWPCWTSVVNVHADKEEGPRDMTQAAVRAGRGKQSVWCGVAVGGVDDEARCRELQLATSGQSVSDGSCA